MRTRTHPLIVLCCTLLVAAEIACDTVAEGKNDLVAFQFDADTALIPAAFNTPVAAGTRAGVLVVKGKNDSTPVSVVDATSSNPAVIEVNSTAGNLITLVGVAAGTAEITVQTVDGEDAFDVSVDTIAKVDLNLPGTIAPDNPPSKGLQGGTARFAMSLKNAAGKDLIGYGEVPVTVAPDGAATLAATQEVGGLSLTFATPGALTVTGQGDDALTVDVIASADLTGLTWKGFAEVPTLPVGGKTVGILRGANADGDTVVGAASLANVTTGDSAICSITANPRLGEGVFTLTAKAKGECQVIASLGALFGRATITVQ